MLICIAYCTAMMGIFGIRTPELLPWERHFKQRLIADIAFLAIAGFDAWFWWVGVWILKPTNGPEQNPIFYPYYFGRAELYGWIRYPARVINIFLLCVGICDILAVVTYYLKNRWLDKNFPIAALLQGTKRWLTDVHNLEYNQRERSDIFQAISESTERQASQEIKQADPLRALRCPVCAHYRTSEEASLPDALMDHAPTSLSAESDGKSDVGSNWTQRTQHVRLGESKAVFGEKSSRPSPNTQPQQSSSVSKKRPSPSRSWLSPAPTVSDSISQNGASSFGCPSALDLCDAENYLDSVTAKRRKYFVLLSPYLMLFDSLFWLVRLTPLVFKKSVRPGVLLACAFYVHDSEQNDFHNYPFLFHAALQHPLHSSVKASDITLLSRLRFAQKPPAGLKRNAVLVIMVLTFLNACLIALATEFTLVWNYVGGVYQLNTVGQLVPLALGTGQLGRVIISVFEKNSTKQSCLGACRRKALTEQWAEVADRYDRAKRRIDERQMEVQDEAVNGSHAV